MLTENKFINMSSQCVKYLVHTYDKKCKMNGMCSI